MTALAELGVDPQVALDWIAVRKAKKSPAPTKTAIDGVVREAAKAGLTVDAALRVCCEKSWVGFDAAWLANAGVTVASPASQQRLPSGFDPRNESTWGMDSRGRFDGQLYIEHKAMAYRMLNGAGEARDMGMAEVVQ